MHTKEINTAHGPGHDAAEPPKKRMSIREAQKQMTRERLLDAASELFKEVGFRDVTIFQIMERAQANRATFYLHFKDKLEVAAAVGRRQGGSANSKLFHELAALINPTIRDVRHWIERRLAFLGADPLFNYVMNEAITSEPKFAEEYGVYLEHIADILMAETKALAHLSGRKREIVRSKIILLTMMMDRFTMHTQHQKLTFPGKLAVDAIAELLWNAIFSEAQSNDVAVAASAKAKSRVRGASSKTRPGRNGSA